MIKIAIWGYGNIGKSAVDACLCSEDMEIIGKLSAGQWRDKR